MTSPSCSAAFFGFSNIFDCSIQFQFSRGLHGFWCMLVMVLISEFVGYMAIAAAWPKEGHI